MKLKLFLTSFLYGFFVLCSCDENITTTSSIEETLTTVAEQSSNPETERTEYISSTVSNVIMEDDISGESLGSESRQSSYSTTSESLASESRQSSYSTTSVSSSSSSNVQHLALSQLGTSTDNDSGNQGTSNSTFADNEIDVNVSYLTPNASERSTLEGSQSTSPSIVMTDIPVITGVVTMTSQISSVHLNVESETTISTTTTDAPVADTATTDQSSLNKLISESSQITTTETETTNNLLTSSTHASDEKTATETQSNQETEATEAVETSQAFRNQNISTESQSETSTQDASTSSLVTNTSHLSEVVTTTIPFSSPSVAERSSELDQNISASTNFAELLSTSRSTTSITSTESSSNSISLTDTTETQINTSKADTSLRTTSQSSTIFDTKATSVSSTIQPTSTNSKVTTKEIINDTQNNATTGSLSVQNSTTSSYEATDAIIAESEKYNKSMRTKATCNTSHSEEETTIRPDAIKYCKQSDIIFALVIMFSLHMLSLTIAILFIFHKMRKGRSWERPIMRYRASAVFNNNGSSPGPQVERVEAVSGLNLATDSECKRGESTPTINIKDGWCRPMEKKSEEKDDTEDTGV